MFSNQGMLLPLSSLKKNQTGRIVSLKSADSALLKFFMEMGFAEGGRVQLIQKIQNILILLTNHGKYSVRTEDCRFIQVEAAPFK